MNYQEAKNYLESISNTGIILGLETIRNLLDELGNPQDDLSFVHLAGTNGKGSVLAYVASITQEAGYKTGQYTSPPLLSRREQIQVNGEWISKDNFAKLVEKVKTATKALEKKNKALPTVYEVETAMAFLYFKKSNCDIVILETGMGGRDDATNIIKNTLVAGFTSISLDHMSFLGERIEEIAVIKAGIIKPNSLVVSGIQRPHVLEILRKRAKTEGATFNFVCEGDIKVIEETYNKQVFTYKSSPPLTLQMAGRHQVENAAVALEIVEQLRGLSFIISAEDMESGLFKTKVFGRFSTIGDKPIFIVDGAHNENGVLRLRDNIIRLFQYQRITFIMGIYRDKKAAEIAQMILPLAKSVYTVSLANEKRTLTSIELKEICEELLPINNDIKIEACTSIDQAVELALKNAGIDGVVIALGSLSYLGTVANHLITRGEGSPSWN